MNNRKFKFRGGLLVLCLLLSFSQLTWAKHAKEITLKESLGLAFQQNASHALYLWEQALAEEREKIQRRPQITTTIEPLGVQNGIFEKPEGSVTLTMPLGENIDIRGNLSIDYDSKLEIEPTGSLTLNYDFFALPNNNQHHFSAEKNMISQTNGLVLEVVDLLIQLRQALGLRDYEEAYLAYLETSLEAARITPSFDALPLRREFKDQVAKLSAVQTELDQLQLRLASLLGTAENGVYVPVLEPKQPEFVLSEDELRQELFTTNPTLQKAQAELVFAQEQLELELKTRGWDLRASGTLSTDTPWQIGLAASKTLYPRRVILEELELAVAKMEYALTTLENSLDEEFRRALQMIKSAERSVELAAEHLTEAKEDWKLRQRQYRAGLVTELQVEEARLSLQQAEFGYEHAQLSHARNVLELFNLCGRDLTSIIFDVIV